MHIPVLKNEVIRYLDLKSGDNVIDLTVGGGGHARHILARIAPKGKLIGLDWDKKALKIARENLKKYKKRINLIQANYKQIKKIKNEQFNLLTINAILLDLGFSSITLEDKSRGYSFQTDGPLDMRYNPAETEKTAAGILNHYSQRKLSEVFKKFGEEKLAVPIAREIVKKRKKKKFKTTKNLVQAIINTYKDKYNINKKEPFIKRKDKIHPATKVFQALRLEVNDELDNLKKALPQTLEILEKGGRLGVISFHSLEDRIVKNFFKKEAKKCICPPEFPVCRCGHEKSLKIITKKPVRASEEEIKKNPKSRSAKLRIAEKI
ncbi:MAG: 16S rRNA (cytosine(1402)-N(4))-methyltransferase RsmH [Patescibacteria group bacterium]|nr:16S rRNA (cytosine(1402)-N(4))-methyltransferase RsmH [Patescibacteria group bacterium]